MKRIIVSILFTGLILKGFSQEVPRIYTDLETSYNNNEFEACIKLAPQVETFSANRSDTLAANSFFYVGDAYVQLGDFEKSIPYREREKNLRSKLGDTEYYSISLYNLASVYRQAGHYAKAGTVADELLVTDKKLYGDNSPEFASSALNIADVYIEIDRFKDAEHLLTSTLRRQQKNTVTYGLLLNKLGDLYTYTSQFSKAEEVLQKATDILFLHAGEDSPEYITAAINLGVLYMRKGKYPEAEEIFDVALTLVDPTQITYATVLNNQALVYQSLGQMDRAEGIFQKIRTLDSASIGISHPDYAITLSNLGQVLCDGGKYAQAEKVTLEALEIQKKNNEGNTVSYARKLNNLARIYQFAGKPDKAIPSFQQAAAIFKKNLTENSPEYATAMFNLGNAHWKAGNGKEGIKYLKSSASIRAKSLGKRHPKYAESIQKIAEYQWEQKQVKEAHESFGAVFDNFYFQLDVTFPGLTEEEKARFYYTNIRDSFEKFNSFATAYAQQDPALVGDIYNYHVNTKGAIMYATEKVKKAIMASKDTVLMNLFEKWHSQKERIARSYSQNQENAALDSLIESASEMEKELTKKSSAFAGQFNRKRVTWQEVQKSLKPGEASVEVLRFKVYAPERAGSFTNSVAYAFLILTADSNAPHIILLKNGNDLEGKFLKFYHNSVKYNLDDTYSYKNYFEPVGDFLQKNKITKCYFSPDGVYNQLNVNTIFNPFTKKYLLDEYDFHMVTNAKELVDNRSVASGKNTSVLIGFPKFNLEKSNAASNGNTAKATRGAVTRGGNLTRGMRGLLRFMRGEEGITELPGTQKEIQQISKLFNNNPEVYLEDRASEDITKQVNNPTYLHIATHGYFLEDEEESGTSAKQYVPNPLLKAGLILAGSENFLMSGQPVNDAGDDGILTAYEAMNLKLDETKLVVLSACETGLGEVKNGEGVYGLQRAFKLAGAQSIVMSLWSVDDDATQELMSTFYSELLKSGKQHEAFRIAQQKIKDKYQKPFYWGAFILVGI
jgi:CHAT domain-containing protein/tetratricopeptide (TPR) repeat protein